MAHVTKFRKTSLPFYICLDFLKFRDVSYMYFRAQLRTKAILEIEFRPLIPDATFQIEFTRLLELA